jgi:hypothetical protein
MEQDVWTESIGDQLQRENVSEQDRLETSYPGADLQEMDGDRAEVHSGNTATVTRTKRTDHKLERNRSSVDSRAGQYSNTGLEDQAIHAVPG